MAKCSKDFQRIKQNLAEPAAWSSRLGSIFTSLNESSPVSADAEYPQIPLWFVWLYADWRMKLLAEVLTWRPWERNRLLCDVCTPSGGSQEGPRAAKSALSFLFSSQQCRVKLWKAFFEVHSPVWKDLRLAYKLSLCLQIALAQGCVALSKTKGRGGKKEGKTEQIFKYFFVEW